jgi:translation initiation factor IF-1
MLELDIKSGEAMFNHIAEKTRRKKQKLKDKDVV